MKIIRALLFPLFVITITPTLTNANSIQKWIDENGHVHYGIRPSGGVTNEHTANKAPTRGNFSALIQGRWELYASSEKIEPNPPPSRESTEMWVFEEQRVTYASAPGASVSYPYRLNGKQIVIDSPTHARYDIVSFSNDRMVWRNRLLGEYLYVRRK